MVKYRLEDDNSSFALGYLIHLLTDQAFHYSFRHNITSKLKDYNLPCTGKELLKIMVNELDALDSWILNNNKKILSIIEDIKEVCFNYSLHSLVDSTTLCKNFEWINKKYVVNNEEIESKYFCEKDLSNFF